MNLTASFRLALNILIHSKLRSWLTIIGIIIGVAAVILITSIGEGAQANIQERFGSLGTNAITISPGGERAGGNGGNFNIGSGGNNVATRQAQKNLTTREVQLLASQPNIKVVMGAINGRVQVKFQGQTSSLNIRGVDPIKWREITTSTIAQGNLLQPSDFNGAIVGNRIANQVFKNPNLIVNSKLDVNGIELKVVGILNPSTGFGNSEDNAMIVVEKTARQILGNHQNDYNSITVIPYDNQNVTEVVNSITQQLQLLRGENEKTQSFTVTSLAATAQTIQDTAATLTLFLSAIALISLLVGAIGIANTMFTAVLERTKDIGIMKAVGVHDSDVLAVFLINAGLVGLAGGLMGVGIGIFLANLVGSISINLPGAGGQGIQAIIPASLIIEMLLFSVVIGAIAGIIPAYRASKLKPSIALKYE